MTTIDIPKKIEKELTDASHKLGISMADFLLNASLYYTKSLQDRMELSRELKLWESTSNKDLAKFESAL